MKKVNRLIIILLVFALCGVSAFADDPPPPPSGGNTFIINVFLQGFFTGSNMMRQAHELKDDLSIAPRWIDPIAEKITIEIHEEGYYNVAGHVYAVTDVVLNTNGTLIVNLPTTGSYWITIRSRNHLETVTAAPIDLSTTSAWDFTTAANKAYGSNQVELETGVWGIYAGDTDQNGLINISDLNPIVASVRSDDKGYIIEDINGDGLLNISDINPVIGNIRTNISAKTP